MSKKKSYVVTFSGEHCVLSTIVEITDTNEDILEEEVIAAACDLMYENYGWDVLVMTNEPPIIKEY